MVRTYNPVLIRTDQVCYGREWYDVGQTDEKYMKSPLLHLASVIYDNPVAIIPEKLDAILRAIGPRLSFDQSALQSLLSSGSLSSSPALSADLFAFDEDAMDDAPDTKPYKTTDAGIAVVPIRGALIKRGGWMQAMSGCSSYETISRAFSTAIRDPLVKAIMFQVDSPGGSTSGCFELSDLIYNSRGIKPIWGCADDMAGSAAYALISSCDRVLATRTAAVGSIGVFALHCDQSELDSKVGAKYTYIFAGDKKVDGNPHEPLSRSARKDMQAEVDRQYEIFVTTVARNRDTSADKVRKTEAGVLFANAACPLLADSVATFDEAMSALTTKISGGIGKSKLPFASPLASSPDVSNNESDSEVTNNLDKSGKGVDDMALSAEQKQRKQEAEDLAAENEAQATLAAISARRLVAKKECAAGDSEDESPKKKKDDGEEEDGEEAAADSMKKSKKASVTEFPAAAASTSTSTAASTSDDRANEIAELCAIAGREDLTGKYILKGYSVKQVRGFLQERRAKESAENTVNTAHSGGSGGAGNGLTMEQALQQARTNALASAGSLSMSKALEQVLAQNPDVYDNYDEERSHLAKTGSRREWQAYVTNKQTGLMRTLGLSSIIDDVPAAKRM